MSNAALLNDQSTEPILPIQGQAPSDKIQNIMDKFVNRKQSEQKLGQTLDSVIYAQSPGGKNTPSSVARS